MSDLTLIDVFAGIGGLSLGFEQGGFRCLAGVEHTPHHRDVFKRIHPDSNVDFWDVSKVNCGEMMEALSLDQGQLDVLVGGPPCQAFSMAGKRRGLRDERGRLVHQFVRLVKELRPRSFVMENVVGLMSIHDGNLIKRVLKELRELKYVVAAPRKVNAADYGVPQIRRRVFIVGLREDEDAEYEFPSPTHFDDALERLPLRGRWKHRQHVTVDEAIGDLPGSRDVPDSEQDDRTRLPYAKPPFAEYQEVMRKGNRKRSITGNQVSVHFDHIVEAISDLEHGEEEPRTRYRRLYPNKPAFTLRAGSGSFTALRPIHPYKPRVITIREAARLQSFPDRIDFSDVKKWAYQGIGNSVPPLLARALASRLREYLG